MRLALILLALALGASASAETKPATTDYGHATGADPRLAPKPGTAPAAAVSAAHGQALQFVKTFCADCHNADKMKGDWDATPLLSTRAVRDNIPEWEEVLKQIADQEMPPLKAKDAKRPTDAQYSAMAGWLQKEIALATGNSGRLARRLNRAEYNNTMRDLLGVDVHPADAFPQDLGREGFDNVAEAQSVSPLLLEKYVRAAKEALDAVIVSGPEPKKISRRYFALNSAQRNGTEPVKASPLGLEKLIETKALDVFKQPKDPAFGFFGLDYGSGLSGKDGKPGAVREGKGENGYEVVLPHDGKGGRRGEMTFKNPMKFGRYKVTVRAYATATRSDGTTFDPSGACVMGISVNGVRVHERPVEVGDAPKVYEFEVQSDRERTDVTIAAASSANKKDEPLLPRLVLCEAKIEGPLYDQWPPAPHRAIFGPEGKWSLDEIFTNFLPRAFRRPATMDEVAKYKALAEGEMKAGSTKEEAVKLALQAVLASPNFLFLVEDSRPDRKLNDYEFAARLSYFLWSSMPDAELTALAKSGKIRDAQTLKAQVLRMLRDAKAEALVDNFAAQWIGFRRLGDIAPDTNVFKGWDEDLRKAMREESEEFFRYVMRENLSVLTFLDSDFTFVNERLAKHYGLDGVKGGEFRKVALKPELGRGGLLTQGGVLTLGSQPTRSSPVFRGKFVVEHLFNRPPPPPPANVPQLDDSKVATPKNMREQLAQHAKDPNCAACHVKIDPWGLALEGFDGIGQSRTAAPDDVTGILPEGQKITGTAGLKQELVKRKDAFVRGLMEKTLLYACGRATTIDDKQQVPQLCAYVTKEGYKFHALVLAAVFSQPFQTR